MMKNLLTTCIGILSLTCATVQAEKPNIIFIFADDWGYGDLSAHGSTFCKTPHIDQMIQEGIDFQNFNLASPVCTPSRAAILTGHHPARHGINGAISRVSNNREKGIVDWLSPKVTLLPKLMKQAGYTTAHYGKWHLTNVMIPDAPSLDLYGYDDYKAFNLPGPNAPADSPIPNALKFIEANKDKPFFINLWIHETHTPHYPKEEYLKVHEDLDEQKKVYAAVISEGDAGVGKVLAKLKELKLDKKTLVIFSSDNGPEKCGGTKKMGDEATGPGLGKFYSVGETGGLKGRKRYIYAGGVRTPFVVWWPGTVPAGKIDKTTSLAAVDILPTFVDIAQGKLPDGYTPDGEVITTALKGEPFKRSTPIFWHCTTGKPDLGIAEGKWKLLKHKAKSKVELYDTTVDYAEQKNVAEQHPEVVKQLVAKIEAWQESLPKELPSDCFSKLRQQQPEGANDGEPKKKKKKKKGNK